LLRLLIQNSIQIQNFFYFVEPTYNFRPFKDR
jgi:hypothetical protein